MIEKYPIQKLARYLQIGTLRLDELGASKRLIHLDCLLIGVVRDIEKELNRPNTHKDFIACTTEY